MNIAKRLNDFSLYSTKYNASGLNVPNSGNFQRLNARRCAWQCASNVFWRRAGNRPRWPDTPRAMPGQRVSTPRPRPWLRPGIFAPKASGCVLPNVESKATPSCRTSSSGKRLARSNLWPRFLPKGRLSRDQTNDARPTPVASWDAARAPRRLFSSQTHRYSAASRHQAAIDLPDLYPF